MWSILIPLVAWNSLLVTSTTSTAWQEFTRDCKRGVHIQCLRQGIRYLRGRKPTRAQKIEIYQRLAVAYDSIGRSQQAKEALSRLLKVAPCQRRFPLLDEETNSKLKKVRLQLYEQDTNPPLLTHIPPGRSTFLATPVFHAQANDDMGVMDVTLFYRFQPSGSFQKKILRRTKGNHYKVSLRKASLRNKKRVEYYIRARDCSGRSTLSVASVSQPRILYLEIPVSYDGSAVAGNILMGVGVITLLGGGLSFYAAYNSLQRWYDIKDIPASELVREEIIFYHILGWTGVGVGILTFSLGSYLSFRPRSQAKKSVKVAVPSRSLKTGGGTSRSAGITSILSKQSL